MEKVLFIGIDFSKLSFDVTILHEGRLEESGTHSKFENSKKGISSFIKWMGKIYHGDLKRDALICGENTGIYSKLLADTLFLEGYTFWLESALQIKRSLGLRRGKSDSKDSRDIAEYAARHKDRCKPYRKPSDAIEALQVLFTKRKLLVNQKTSLQRRSGEQEDSFADNRWLCSIDLTDNGIIEVFKKEITAVEQQMKAIIKATPELKRVYDILTSFKGIGLINAVALIVATDNFQRFDFDARKICSYWGIAPFACQSGTSLNGKPHVSGYADRYLKSLLSEAVLTAMQFCPAIRDYAMRLRARGKHRAIIANNCKNKMLHILVAMVKNGTRYGEQKNDDAA